MDIARKINDICDAKGFRYHYGNKSHINLIDSNSDLEPNKVHLLLFPVRRGKYERNTNSRVCNGNFFFVLPDNFANAYLNETDAPESESKYVTKIEPLELELNTFEKSLDYCNELDVITFEYVDAIDVLDANMTGFWVTFQFRVYE